MKAAANCFYFSSFHFSRFEHALTPSDMNNDFTSTLNGELEENLSFDYTSVHRSMN